MELTEIKKKTFKDVHTEIENEFRFLREVSNNKEKSSFFVDKANVLKNVGFENSIATKLYSAISDNYNEVEDFYINCNKQYKLLLQPLLERICEKYNLFVRKPEFYIGDIPEKNVNDISNFKIMPKNLFSSSVDISKYFNRREIDYLLSKKIQLYDRYRNIPLNEFIEMLIEVKQEAKFNNTYWDISLIKKAIPDAIQIVAVESLFSKEAFAETRDRIISTPQKASTFEVDLDPIVLCKINIGQVVVTAWGDEANDELVVNQNFN